MHTQLSYVPIFLVLDDLFYILSKGKHPFGDDVMSREGKILDRSNVCGMTRLH